MNQEPVVWLRSFPHLEEAKEADVPKLNKPEVAPDRDIERPHAPDPPDMRREMRSRRTDKSDPREWYINLLKKLQ
jgi:hypothetical protein